MLSPTDEIIRLDASLQAVNVRPHSSPDVGPVEITLRCFMGDGVARLIHEVGRQVAVGVYIRGALDTTYETEEELNTRIAAARSRRVP